MWTRWNIQQMHLRELSHNSTTISVLVCECHHSTYVVILVQIPLKHILASLIFNLILNSKVRLLIHPPVLAQHVP